MTKRRIFMGLAISALTLANCGGRTAGLTGSGGGGDGTGSSGGRGGSSSGPKPQPGTTGAGGFVGTGGAAAAGAGALGSGGAAGASGGAPAQCPAPLPITQATILDFDHGVGDGMSEGMYVYNDPDFGGTITPSESDVAQGIVSGGPVGNAFRFLGTGFAPVSWGAGFGVWLACTNGSSASGIRFHMKSDRAVRVSVTTPGNLPTFDGGACAGDYATCIPHSVDLPALNGWTEVAIDWSALSGGYPTAFTQSSIVGIGFQVLAPVGSFTDWGFDVAVDELEWLGIESGAGGQPGAGGFGGEPAQAGQPGQAGQGGDPN